MNGRVREGRMKGIERARELLELSKKRELTADEIEELKTSHTGYGGMWGDSKQYFTPSNVASFMVNLIPDLKDGSRILEFSCGAGALIKALYDRNPSIDVTGVEISKELASIASLCYPQANIVHGDALSYLEEFEGSFDFVVGNPPFGQAPKIEGFKHAKRKHEEYFLELAVRSLKKGGEGVLLVPDGLLANKSSKPIREWLLNECYYRGTISLPPETFYFSGTQCKTSVIFFKKKDSECTLKDYSVFMAICEDIGWDKKGRVRGEGQLNAIYEAYLADVEPMQKVLMG